jgi:hypothetical protein
MTCCNPNGTGVTTIPRALNLTGSAWAAGTVAPGGAEKFSTPVDLAIPGGELTADMACVIICRTNLIPDAGGYVRASLSIEVSADGGANYFAMNTVEQAVDYGDGVPQSHEYVCQGEAVATLGPVTPVGGVLKFRAGLINNAASEQPAQFSLSQVSWFVGRAAT